MRRSASEVIKSLESRIARLEKSAANYNPNDLFEIEEGNGYIRFYLGGKFNTRGMSEDIERVFFKEFQYIFISENSFPTDDYMIEECIEDAFDKTEMVEELSRPRKGEKAIQVNLFKKDEFVRNVIKDLEGEIEDLEKNGSAYILDWSDAYEAGKACKAGVKALMAKYGSLRSNRIDPRTYRLASTRKVAGHIILADNVNVRQLRRELEDTFGIEDIDIEDGVITFLMSSMDNKKVEKQVNSLAQKHDVKFEKGEFTDGLGMIYTKQASRTNRRASKPMFNLVLIKETTVFDEETDYETYETETEELVDENINSFEELLEELDSNHHITNWSWGEWSERRPVVDGDGRRAWITSATEENMMMYAEERTTLHFNPARGVRLDKVQIKMIEKALGMR
jgi:hypothetical protein